MGERKFMLKPYTVTVDGFSGIIYSTASRGKALAEAWRDYQILGYVAFGDFLKIARVRLSDKPPRFGEPIEVAGHPAFYVGESMQYVRFVRPGQTVTLLAHPADVKAPPTPPSAGEP